jgi:hypothetical protein
MGRPPLRSLRVHGARSGDALQRASESASRSRERLRRMLNSHADLSRQLAGLEKKYDAQFKVVFDAIRELMKPSAAPAKGRKIGFHQETDSYRPSREGRRRVLRRELGIDPLSPERACPEALRRVNLRQPLGTLRAVSGTSPGNLRELEGPARPWRRRQPRPHEKAECWGRPARPDLLPKAP